MSDRPSLDDPDLWIEYGWTCAACGREESWTSEVSSKLSAALHVRDQHPEYLDMVALADDDVVLAMLKNNPERYGRRLEDWESQL